MVIPDLLALPESTHDDIANYGEISAGSVVGLCDAAPGAKIVPLKSVVSTKDQRTDRKFLAGTKADPRQVALDHMQKAAANQGSRRGPITVVEHSDGLFYVVDGNATVQVLMLAEWKEVPVSAI